jgi:hypothetical protein
MFADANDYERFMGCWSRLVAPQLVDLTDVPDLGRLLDAQSVGRVERLSRNIRQPK